MQAFSRNEGAAVPSLARRRRREERQREQEMPTQLRPDIAEEELEGSYRKKNPIPRVISLVELYKSYLELLLTIGVSILFLFLHLELAGRPTQMSAFIDLSLAPWLVWLTKKLMDTIKSYKIRMLDCKAKFEAELQALEVKRAALITLRGGVELLPHPVIDNSMDQVSFDEGAGLILQARTARRMRTNINQMHQANNGLSVITLQKNLLIERKAESIKRQRCSHVKYLVEIVFLILFLVRLHW